MKLQAQVRIISIAALLACGNLACPPHRAHAENFTMPLSDKSVWQFLSFRNITPNAFHGKPDGMEIVVKLEKVELEIQPGSTPK